MNGEIGSGTAAGLFDFLDFLVKKGYATQGSVSPLVTASRKILSTVEGEAFESVDVRNLDVDEYVSRFSNQTLGEYNGASLRAYGQRFRRALDWYKSYLADPNWKPEQRSIARLAPKGKSKRTDKPQSKRVGQGVKRDPEVAAAADQSADSQMITYPFPLKSGRIAQLVLPTNLDGEDADRLTQFVRALVLKVPAQLGSGDMSSSQGD